MQRRRWEGDERGHGIASAEQLAGEVDRLIDAMRGADWVAEDPEHHFLPHIEAAVAAGTPFTIVSTESNETGEFVVRLRGAEIDRARPRAALREAIFALVGSFAESSTYVEDRTGEEFVVVTGMLGEGTTLGPHGHVVRFVVER